MVAVAQTDASMLAEPFNEYSNQLSTWSKAGAK